MLPIVAFLPIKQPAPIDTLSESVTPDSITALAPIETLLPIVADESTTAEGCIPWRVLVLYQGVVQQAHSLDKDYP